ncbi:MAG TPA: hypothetical protein VEW74_09185 [Candidatus Nitrosotalea sp.]|nr:hypothetical protein [Candidatus Nitrosotalea sp.]
MNSLNRFAAFAVSLLATVAVAAAATPGPSPAPKATRVYIHLPSVPLHTEVDVEVNSKGQVVRVKSTKPSKVASFNLQTYGNALQMWIRRPDGTAQVGLYRVTYDYNPKNTEVTRRVSLISAGGTWGNDEGAALVMAKMAQQQAAAAEAAERKAQQRQQEQNAKLPSLNEIRGVPTPKPSHLPTPSATLPPKG